MEKQRKEEVTAIIPSRKTIEENYDFLGHVLETGLFPTISPVSPNIIQNNTRSLTEVYQEALETTEGDIIVFMHDDIEFLKPGWADTIYDIFKRNPQYGIIGVAGSRIYGEKDKLAWWDCDAEFKRGFIFHGDENKSWPTIFSDFNDNVDLMEVAVVDGVFMAVNKKRIQCGFDTNIKGFHFYDIDFCISNFLSHKCRIGVTNKIAIRHKSTGVINEEWVKNGQYVIEKYKNNLPIKVFRK